VQLIQQTGFERSNGIEQSIAAADNRVATRIFFSSVCVLHIWAQGISTLQILLRHIQHFRFDVQITNKTIRTRNAWVLERLEQQMFVPTTIKPQSKSGILFNEIKHLQVNWSPANVWIEWTDTNSYRFWGWSWILDQALIIKHYHYINVPQFKKLNLKTISCSNSTRDLIRN
jgi:hypothetical protein